MADGQRIRVFPPSTPQPHRAGEVEREGSSRTTYLAPLPLPTGMPAMDVGHAIGELNDVWLDYGTSSPNVFGYQLAIGVPLFFVVFWLVIVPLLLISGMDWELYRMFLWTAVLGGGAGVLIMMSAVRHAVRGMARTKSVRFHRQRREVCFIVEGKTRDALEAVIVPWESLMAWVVEGRGATQYGATRQYGVGIGFAHPETGQWLSVEAMAAGPAPALGGWEAIRAYMEYRVNRLDEIQDAERLREPGDPPYQGAHTIRNARRRLHEQWRQGEVSWWFVLGWYGLYCLELGTLPGHLAERDARRLAEARPQRKLAEVEAWSQPLPREQWAKPSQALVALSAAVREAIERDRQRPIEQIYAEAYARRDAVA